LTAEALSCWQKLESLVPELLRSAAERQLPQAELAEAVALLALAAQKDAAARPKVEAAEV
jgi:hypothetical protein